MKGEPILVMLVEDNADHAELVIRTLEDHRIANKVIHFLDGQTTLVSLLRRHGYEDPEVTPRPHMRAYSNHVNSYLVKPVGYEEFSKLMNDLGFYWLGWNTHPLE